MKAQRPEDDPQDARNVNRTGLKGMTSRAQCARRLLVDLVQAVGAAAGALGFVTDVVGRAVEVRGGRCVTAGFLVFERPGRFGTLNLLEVCDTGVHLA